MSQLKDRQIAHQYAIALIEESRPAQSVDELLHTLYQLKILVEQHPDIVAFFENPAINATDRQAVINEQLLPDITPLTGRLVALLVESHRFALLPVIFDETKAICDGECGVATITVRTAMPLDEALSSRLTQRLQETLGLHSVQLAVEVQPGLLSGVVLEWNDIRLDASLRGQLTQIERTLAGASAL